MASDEPPEASEQRGLAIAQFMWAFQPHFRISVESTIKSALGQIGFTSKPEVILVGFQVSGQHAFPICIEPEKGPYDPVDLSGVVEQGRTLYEQHPDRQSLHSDARTHNLRHLALRDRMRADALGEALSATNAGGGRKFFASRSVRVDDYEVHVMISLDLEALTTVPCLRTTTRDRMGVTPSLLHAVVYEVLGRAGVALYEPEAGSSLNVVRAGPYEIVRSAAESFVRSALLCAGHWSGSEMDLVFNSLSSLPYEGRPGAGQIILAKPDTPSVKTILRLKDSVNLRDARAVRKLIESTGALADLLSDGERVHGLGMVESDYDPTAENVFVVNIVTRGTWELSHAEHPLMSVRDGLARLPDLPLNIPILRDAIERLLPEPDVEKLIDLAQAAARHHHGAMLIISADAAGEAARLSPQVWSTEPNPVSPEIVSQLTAMDGGILVDPQGCCHAIGVILDGMASGIGIPSRGSRFNNAVRYLNSSPPPAVVVVYSADGTIDVLPQLMPRISRETVHAAVEKYVTAVAVDPPEVRRANEAWDQLMTLEFYLSQEQCDAVNAARATLQEWDRKNRSIWLVTNDLKPDSRMDDTYWLP